LTANNYFEKYSERNSGNKETAQMASMDEQILRATKEIVVKFIEGGRISPASFPDFFKNIYQTVHETAIGASDSPTPDEKDG
jgi:predicted transcriptional regulator